MSIYDSPPPSWYEPPEIDDAWDDNIDDASPDPEWLAIAADCAIGWAAAAEDDEED